MRRHGNLYEKISSLENVRLAYVKTRKGKRWQRQIRNFDLHVEENIKKVHQMLVNKTFKTSTYTTKRIYEPKKRVIYIVPFSPDRIVHHALMNILEPIYKPMFIHDSSCIASYTGWMRWANCHNLGLKLQLDKLQEILNASSAQGV